MFTALRTAPLTRKSVIASATSIPTLSCASLVLAPRCGVITILGSARNGDSSGHGSVSYTSSAQPATLPLCTAATMSVSLIIPPRAQFTRNTPSFIRAMLSALIMSRVWSVNGICTVMKSERSISSSSSSNSTCNSRALLKDKNGSYANTRIPKAIARRAT